ncbi:hypothetical protein SH528x_003461 [Novipirellula sp. SH528]|uniref:hypothetical protein n=1 Tax=Novipirellula sp. SH528 TaxID=3454466 RepID=UPI003FA06369
MNDLLAADALGMIGAALTVVDAMYLLHAANQAMVLSGGGRLFDLLASQLPPPAHR